jgi:hypothetical protein
MAAVAACLPVPMAGFMPLIGVALAQGREDEAWAYIQALLESTQQILPVDLNTSLEAAVQAKAKGQAGEDRLHLNQALELAKRMGYL